ncbi:hypothetical protein EXS54_02330 [Patescibacteria group bacterium]|nr:hypothetical protein [Patescibacteria group bacterium]
MSLRAVLWGLGISSTLCWIAWILTVLNTNPDQGGQAAVLSFYLSLFAGLFGTVTLIGYALRRVLTGNELKYSIIRTSFRQGFLVAAITVTLLLLQSARLLSGWDVALLIVTVVLLELYLRSYGRTQHV